MKKSKVMSKKVETTFVDSWLSDVNKIVKQLEGLLEEIVIPFKSEPTYVPIKGAEASPPLKIANWSPAPKLKKLKSKLTCPGTVASEQITEMATMFGP